MCKWPEGGAYLLVTAGCGVGTRADDIIDIIAKAMQLIWLSEYIFHDWASRSTAGRPRVLRTSTAQAI